MIDLGNLSFRISLKLPANGVWMLKRVDKSSVVRTGKLRPHERQ